VTMTERHRPGDSYLDAVVYRQIGDDPRTYQDLRNCFPGAKPGDVRAAILRLANDGKIYLDQGFGWRRTK
jgi:hypothetical protein